MNTRMYLCSIWKYSKHFTIVGKLLKSFFLEKSTLLSALKWVVILSKA